MGLDVEDRGAVDGVEAAHRERGALHAHQLAGADPEAVGPVLAPLGEDADRGPVGVPPGPAEAGADPVGVDAVEEVDHVDVAEGPETGQGLGPEGGRREMVATTAPQRSSATSDRGEETTPTARSDEGRWLHGHSCPGRVSIGELGLGQGVDADHHDGQPQHLPQRVEPGRGYLLCEDPHPDGHGHQGLDHGEGGEGEPEHAGAEGGLGEDDAGRPR